VADHNAGPPMRTFGDEQVRRNSRVETPFVPARACEAGTAPWPGVSRNGSHGARRMRRRGCCFDGRAAAPPAAGARMLMGDSERVGWPEAAPEVIPNQVFAMPDLAAKPEAGRGSQSHPRLKATRPAFSGHRGRTLPLV
jgi:hypothetical protein